MLDIDEVSRQINNLKTKLSDLKESMKLSEVEEELANLENQTLSQDFWQDTENQAKVLSKISSLKKKVTLFKNVENDLNATQEIFDLVVEENDNNLEIFQNNCLALTIKEEYRLQVTYRVFNKSFSVSVKSIFSAAILTILNIIL